MKSKLLFVSALIVVGLVAVVALSGEPKKEDEDRQAASPPPADTSVPKVVGVDVVAQDPKAHAGQIAVEGIVAKVLAERGAVVLIDKAEFEACGTLDCAMYSVPLIVPKDQFEGELPKLKEKVVALGELQPSGKGYTFTVREVRREGKRIMTRTKPPTPTRTASGTDLLPGTLLDQKEALGLKPKQIEKLNAAHAAFTEAQQKWQEKITHCQAELVEVLEKKPVNQAKVDHEKKEIEEFKEKLADERKTAEDAARAVLTSEQAKKLGA